MSLTIQEMARLGELLDEVLPLTLEQRSAWLHSLSPGDLPLVRTLRDTLLTEEAGAGGPLDRLPRIATDSAEEEGAARHHAGERFGAYELVRLLGSGGMADVWLACRTDGAFERQVALKIPRLQGRPVVMTARFALECNILAALEYPGIARLYDAGLDASGMPYIAMEYVQGEPLVAWCDARGLGEAARLQIFLQVLDAVACAHGRQVIHRDLKPSNILVTGQGEVRLLDFGVAQLLQPNTDAALLTRDHGLALTPEYASPELLRGELIDSRSDLYSLGIVLHELLTGARPAQTARPANPDTRRLRGVLRDVVAKALQPDPSERYPDAASFAAALQPFADGKANHWLGWLKTHHPSGVALAALAVLVGMAAVLAWTLQVRDGERWAREEALPQLQALISEDNYAGAFDLANQIEGVTPNDPLLLELRPAFSAAVKLNTAPEGATVFFRPYDSTEEDWRRIGETPLVDVPVPIGVGLWRIEKEGRDTAILAIRNPGLQLGNDPYPDFRALAEGIDFTIPLADATTSQDGMVLVPEYPSFSPPVDDDFVEVPTYFMDRFEVSNHEFKEFVDASGYSEAAYWRGLPFDSDSGGWQPVVQRFVDLDGQPGPSTWQAGTYRDGTADDPVTGVSWFEAAAYCHYRGKELPTVHHWERAANSVLEFWESLSSAIVHSSNFAGLGLDPVGRLDSLGPFGTYDMAGNAREWLWNQGSEGRLITGGAFNDRPYQYNMPDEAPPFDRSAVNGIRCMRTLQDGLASEVLRRPVAITNFDYAALEPVSDATFALLAQQLDYRSLPFTPRVEEVNSPDPAWTRQRIELPTGYDQGTFVVQLFLPTAFTPPYQVVFVMPDGGDFLSPISSDGVEPSLRGIPVDFLLRSGRALAVVAFDGTFERRWPAEQSSSMTAEETRTRMRRWRQELGRTIDHFATRPDLNAEKLGWFGVSAGASSMVSLMAVEKRIDTAVLYSGGIAQSPELPMSEWPFNYYPHVTQPALMLNGRWDLLFPLPSQQRMLELLGTPEGAKKHLLFEAGHGNLPRFQVEHATLDWFDRYLGQPTRR